MSKSAETDEVFMAWYYAGYVEEIASAGKNVYNLPMYLNAALIREGYKPGEYPSAGPLPHLFEIWKTMAPSIDMLSPDIYFTNWEFWCEKYNFSENVLFIPEIKNETDNGMQVFSVLGKYKGIGFSPFFIESVKEPENSSLGKSYELLRQAADLITEAQATGEIWGGVFDEKKKKDTVELVGYKMVIAHDYTLGWTSDAKNDDWPLSGVLILSNFNGEYYFIGNGVVITFLSKSKDLTAGIDMAEEGRIEDNIWKPGRRLNGDQTHQGRHIRIPMNSAQIQKVRLYTY